MKHVLAYCVFLIAISFSALNASATNVESYKNLMKLDSHELMVRGSECEKREKMDSALLYYSIICNRSYNVTEDEEIRRCCLAYIKKSIIYFSYFFDYSKAYENILSAAEVQEQYNKQYSFVYNTEAMFYHVIAVTCRDWNMERKALDYCQKAYETAVKEGDRKNMDVYFINMSSMFCNLDDMSVLDKVWDTYHDDNIDTYSYKFNVMFYNYINYRRANDIEKSVNEAKKMLELSIDSSDVKRILMSYTSIVDSYEKKCDYANALKYLLKEEKLVKEKGMREHVIEILDSKNRIYRNMGDSKTADSCLHAYLIHKDSLLNLNQMNNISRTHFNVENRKMENEMTAMSIKNHIYNKVIIVAFFVLAILIFMVVMLYIKIKQLKKSNITIYENNVELFKNEEKERQKLKSEVLKLEKESEESVIPEEPKESEESQETEPVMEEDLKYKTNSISEDEKKKLLDKILTVMEDVDEICSESFSGTRLAELTGSKYNYVSLVINENYGCNFNNFLNRFRIKEACRRLADDDNYGNYTIDTISNSLGFKSRTTLTTSFKKIVGLTPSQYRTIAKEKK